MKGLVPVPLVEWPRDSSYGRLLRRLDQALDMARTREWLNGRSQVITELELNGLSPEDQQLLWRIINALGVDSAITPAPYQTEQQTHHCRGG